MLVIYGIPNCDTVKKARRWLEGQGIDYQFHDFRRDGLTAKQVRAWLDELGAERLINKRSATWKQLSPQRRSELQGEAAVQLLREHPTLIKRPLLDTGSKRLVGFAEADYRAALSSP